jgi:hypothetical protein
MTRDEFMAQAVASGKSKDEIKRVYDSIEAAGEFSDSSDVSHETTPTKEPGYLQTLAQPLIDTEAKLHARSEDFNTLPLAQKPARFINDLAGGAGDVIHGLAATATNLIPRKAQAAIGDVLEGPAQAAGSAVKAVGEAIPQPVKDLAQGASNAVKGFSEEHPIISEYAKAIPNAALMAVPAAKGLEAGNAEADAIGNSIGGGLQDFAKLGQGKSWKLSGTPEAVASKRDIAAENGIWGKAREGAEQTNDLISQKYADLKQKITDASGQADTQVKPLDLLENARATALENADPLKEDAINAAFDKIEANAQKKFGDAPIDLADAQMYKQKLGEWGDDVFDVTKKGKNITAQGADHQAYATAYNQFKTAIEDVGPPGIKEQNQELSKLLELRKDLRKRTAVQERNNFMPIDEIITGAGAALSGLHGNPLPAMLYGANVATKSPNVAKGLYNLGTFIKGGSQ